MNLIFLRYFFYQQTRCSRGCSVNTLVINWFIHWLGHPFVQNLQDTVYPKPYELGSWNFERKFNPHHVSDVTCHVSRVTCQGSGVRCEVSGVKFHIYFFKDQGGGASLGRVCYQQGLPRLFFFFFVYKNPCVSEWEECDMTSQSSNTK